MNGKSFFCPIVLVIVWVVAGGSMNTTAQTSRGTVAGMVSDPNGAIILGAEVELKNTATNVSRNTTTNDSGLYRFDAVDLGTYEVIIRMKGFKTANRTDVLAQANRITTADVNM